MTQINTLIASPLRWLGPKSSRPPREDFFKRRQARARETQQLYHFAELGQLSTLLLHELANHLSVLTLDVQALATRGRVRALARTFETLTQLEQMVSEVREHLMHNQKACAFNVAHSTQKVVSMLQVYASQSGMAIQLDINDQPSRLVAHGDPTRFHLLITILLKNAVEAAQYQPTMGLHPITISLSETNDKLVITISDWGRGFARNQETVFQPFRTTKEHGMGIGLFITKTIVETHFQGTIQLTHTAKPTVFSLTLPLKK